MRVKAKVVLSLSFIALVMIGLYVWKGKNSERDTPRVREIDPGLASYLVESKICDSPRDCAEKIEQMNFIDTEKRQYCCLVEFKSDVIVDESWHKCRGHKEWRNELGRLMAQYRCRGFNIGWTSGDELNSGWSVGTEFGRELVARDCKDEPRCSNGGKTPWVVPECYDGDYQFVKEVFCKVSGSWTESLVCQNGKWKTQVGDFGCINTPGGSIR